MVAGFDDQKKKILQDLKHFLTQLSAEEFARFEQTLHNFQQDSHFLEQLQQEQQELQRLLQALERMHQENDIPLLLQELLQSIIALSQAERGYVIYVPPSQQQITVAHQMEQPDPSDPIAQFSQNVVQIVLNTGTSVVSENALEDPLFSKFPSIREFQLVSILCVPIHSQSRVVGAIFVENRNISHLFNNAILKKVESYAHQFALVLQRAELLKENQEKAQLLALLNEKLAAKVLRQQEDLEQATRLIEEQSAELAQRYSFHQMVGSSAIMQQAFQRMEKCAKTDLPVLISGESGTGKELAAKAIHYSSKRRNKIFLAENCAGLSEHVLESELFGHERGAFTGAVQSKKGLFELAHQGTLFLDEIGETSLNLQKKLLRVLQEGVFRRVGGEKWIQIDVRIVSATNKTLETLVAEGKFREDLFYRLSVLRVDLPPLREREGDLELLVSHFLNEIAKKTQGIPKKIAPQVLHYLQKKSWPGNVRQLYNYLQRLATFTEGPILYQIEEMEEIALPKGSLLQIELSTFPQMLENLEKQAIEFSMKKCNGNKSKAAKLLGISRYALLRKMHKIED